MKAPLPTAGSNPVVSNETRKLNRRFKEAEKDMKIFSEKGRLARKRKKLIYKAERKSYSDLIRSVMVELQNRKQGISG